MFILLSKVVDSTNFVVYDTNFVTENLIKFIIL